MSGKGALLNVLEECHEFTNSVEDLQMMSKTELNTGAIKAAGGHDKWLKTLDSNLQ